MKVDATLLDWAEKCASHVTVVRLYRWSVPTISLGKNQRAEEAVALDYCRRAAIPIVRRPTGGRAVFHQNEVTYALISNDSRYFPLQGIRETYQLIATALEAGLQRLGIPIQLAKGIRESGPDLKRRRKNPCFVSPSRYELLFDGLKIVGSAQRRLRRSFLQHGSIPLQVDYAQMAAALGTEEKVLRKTLISVWEATGRKVAFETVCRALKAGVEKSFTVQLSQPAARNAGFKCDFYSAIASP
ncbi:lipoate--protein ligase family protein [Acidobacteria bacterium AH-259-D05]|nr:lipoate--protein ligase family protein [Acidobacteria bacterium AH-259-D05]